MRGAPAALVVLPAAWLAGARGVTLAPWSAAVTVAVAAALLALAALRGLRLHRATPWLAALVAWAAVTVVARPVDRAEAAWLLAAAAVALALAVVVGSPGMSRAGGWAVLAAGLAVAPWLVVQRVALHLRPAGPFDDPNLGATLLVLALAVLPALPLPAPWSGGTAAWLAAGVLASGSRAGLLAVAVVAATWLPTRRARGAALLTGALLLAVGGGLALRVAADRDPLRWERVRIWRAAVETALAEAPLGCGVAGFRDAALPHNFPQEGAFARYGRIPGAAESDFLELAATLGVPGLAIAAGLALCVLRAARGRPAATGVVAALAVTSAFHSQLDVPVIAWVATLAIGATVARPRGPRWRLGVAPAVAGALAVAVPAAAALSWPRGGTFPDPERLLRGADAVVARVDADDRALAAAELEAWTASRLQARSPRGWTRLGDVRLRRALLWREQGLAQAAARAYERAAATSPLDVWAALGAGRARAALGAAGDARRWFRRAVALEPNCAPAWLELARLDLEAGRIAAARGWLERTERILAAARPAEFVGGYERALINVDRELLARLRAALGKS